MTAGTAQPPPLDARSDRTDPTLRALIFTLVIGALAVIFDTTIMSVAVNSLAGQLHTSLGTIDRKSVV